MDPVRTHLDRSAAALMVVLCLFWGLQQVLIKLATPGISPVLQAGLRSLGAVVLVILWTVRRGIPLARPDGTLIPGLAAGALFAAEFGLLYAALLFTTASRGVIFLYTAPFMVSVVAARWLPNEHMGRSHWIGLALAFAGVVALFGDNVHGGGALTWLGDLMMLAAAMAWAATTLTIKFSSLATAPPEKTLLYQLAVSALVLPPLSALLGESGVTHVDATVAASMLFQICVVASFSYLCWFWLVRHYPATRLSAFSFLTPVMGVLAGVLLLGEPLTPGVVAALATVGGGIRLANRPPRPSAAAIIDRSVD